ncbi:MAG: DUF5011 domain-containing protein [Ruminococcus sp.]|nr:DUF5011 domain-containing protein [Ruminococcus sp.]
MSVKIRMISLLALCALLLSLSACAVRIAPPRDMTAEEEAVNMGFEAVEHDGKITVGGYEYLEVSIKLDYENEVKWSSSDPEVAVVDSNGRVDGIKVGKAIITATAKTATIDYEIEVTKADKVTTSYSTAFTDNQEYVKVNKQDSEKDLYAITVNEANCCVTVYTYNAEGKYTKPVRVMVCSTGKSKKTIEDDDESWVTNEITEKAEWVVLSDGNHYRYATYIGDELMFQSAPYSKDSEDSLITEEYNKIGTPATAKNIRLSVADAKWIYDNCNEGTDVRIINSDYSAYTPLGVPTSMKLTENSKSLNWDPTDSSKNNPYTKLKPVISGAEDIVIEIEKGFDLFAGVTATDTCGNDITDKITVDGDFDRNVEGRYVISYYVTDVMGRNTRVDREITVLEDLSQYTTAPAVE